MAQIKVVFEDGSHKVLAPNAYAQIAAKRRFGLDAIKSEDPEVLLFAVFVQDVGAIASTQPDAFDTWLQNVATFELEGGDEEADDGADPPVATETPSPPLPA